MTPSYPTKSDPNLTNQMTTYHLSQSTVSQLKMLLGRDPITVQPLGKDRYDYNDTERFEMIQSLLYKTIPHQQMDADLMTLLEDGTIQIPVSVHSRLERLRSFFSFIHAPHKQ